MTLIDKIEEFLNNNEIKYFQGNDENNNIINLPYRGIKDKSNHINIYLEVFEETKLVKFSLIQNRNESMDLAELKSQLLDLNSTINLGTLAMRNDSNTIEFKIDCVVDDNWFSYDIYSFFIINCINIYEKLKDKAII